MVRIVTPEMDLSYGDRLPADDRLVPGDMIVDAPTNANNDVHLYFFSRDWSNFREGGTVWIDGNLCKDNNVRDFIFRNGGQMNTPWHVNSARFKPIPGTQVKGRNFTNHGLKSTKILGSSALYPGLYALNEGKIFLSGNFGFHMKQEPRDGHNYAISVLDGGEMEIEGIEAQFGFSGIRGQEGAYNQRSKMKVRNFYIHDTGDGEAFYLGRTTSEPVPYLELDIADGICARISAEALQMQHLVGSDVHNITIAANATNWRFAFQPYQSTGLQTLVEQGINKLHHLLVDGYGTVAISMFGGFLPANGAQSLIEDIAFIDGRSTGHYLHNSAVKGVDWQLRRIYYNGFNDWLVQAGNKRLAYVTSERHGSDNYLFEDIQFNSKEKFFEKSLTGITQNRVDNMALPLAAYKRSGMHEPMSYISQYADRWGKYHPITYVYDSAGKVTTARKDVPIAYAQGEIIIDVDNFQMYKVLAPHTSVFGTRPADFPAVFFPLKWDVNGVRNDQPGYINSQFQSLLPPDDLRQVKDSYWWKKGYGYIDEEEVVEVVIRNEVRYTTTHTGRKYKENLKSYLYK